MLQAHGTTITRPGESIIEEAAKQLREMQHDLDYTDTDSKSVLLSEYLPNGDVDSPSSGLARLKQ